MMKLFAAFAIICALAAMPAAADTHGSLFVNLTTDESHRADMAMAFSKAMMERDHPVVVWLNDKGVFIASKEHAGKFAEQQKMLSALMSKGVIVIACPMSMKHYGVKEADLIEAVKVGDPDLTGDLLFKEDTKTLTW
jgi:predicted peroxiredoxin